MRSGGPAAIFMLGVVCGPAMLSGCAGSAVVGVGATLSSTADALGTLLKRAARQGENPSGEQSPDKKTPAPAAKPKPVKPAPPGLRH